MFGESSPRRVDVLKELHECLHAYVVSGQRLVEYLAVNNQMSSPAPRNVLQRINESYHGGVLYLRNFIPAQHVCGPEEEYTRVSEAEQCITRALREVYGIKKKTARKKSRVESAWPVAANTVKETEEEKAVKRELRWVLFAPSMRKELDQLKDNFKYVAANKSIFPSLNEYATFASFDRRIRPFMVSLELEVLPTERAIGRVEHFLHTLYRNTDKALVADEAKKNKKK
ncbi:MAG: hypothetical protein Q7S52_05265 [bacterium]|nr:hypothetical protein [bacterium]